MSFYEAGLLASPAAFVAALLIGLSFGFWLERAGFGSARKLAGIFYLRDFAVVQVMFTAVVTGLVGLWALEAAGVATPASLHRIDTNLAAQLAGGAIFGAGFVIGGWCPGTALVGAASGKLDALAFLLSAGVGSLAYALAHGALAPIEALGACGVVTLPELLGISAGVLTTALFVVALALFAGIARLERRRRMEVLR
ncbi:MAG: YeeE/YedE family protein [Planctomycetes bacterium]|nr:YeeE/YedE family protein [Planctomycetota bacterium]